MKKALKWAGIVLCVILLLVVLFFAVLTLTEYKPAERESLTVEPGLSPRSLAPGAGEPAGHPRHDHGAAAGPVLPAGGGHRLGPVLAYG